MKWAEDPKFKLDGDLLGQARALAAAAKGNKSGAMQATEAISNEETRLQVYAMCAGIMTWREQQFDAFEIIALLTHKIPALAPGPKADDALRARLAIPMIFAHMNDAERAQEYLKLTDDLFHTHRATLDLDNRDNYEFRRNLVYGTLAEESARRGNTNSAVGFLQGRPLLETAKIRVIALVARQGDSARATSLVDELMLTDESWRVPRIEALLAIANVEAQRGIPVSVRDRLASSLAGVLSTAATRRVERYGYADFTTNSLEKIAERLYSAGLVEEAQRCDKVAHSRRDRSQQEASTQPTKMPSVGP